MKKDRKRKVLSIAITTALSGLFAIGCINTQDYKKVSAESQNYNLQITPTNIETNSYRDTQTNLKVAEQQYAKLNNSNTAINVQGNFYSNMNGLYTTNQPQITIYNSYNDNMNGYCVQGLFAFQITPYNNNINTEIQASLNINLELLSHEVSNIYLNIQLIRSLDTYFNNFINNQTWTTRTAIYDWIDNLDNPELMLDYTTTSTRTLLTNDGYYDGTKTVNQTITITPNNTNYFLVYIIPEITSTNQYDEESIEGTGLHVTQENIINISGTNLIPTGQYEIVDIGGLIFQIVTTPFMFFSTAFNLTLFPNTPYQINISTLILGILAVIIFVFLIKLIIDAMSKMG